MQRNHIIKGFSNEDTPSQAIISIHCNTCGKEFDTTARSYDNARQTGCPHCKAIKAKNQTGYTKKPKTQPVVSTTQEEKLNRARNQVADRIRKRGEMQRIHNLYSREQLIEYLKKDSNEYNSFMLKAMEQEQALLDNPDLSKSAQVHHIIPRHAGGPDTKWNKVYLTPADHCEAHILRYQAFNEFGDYNFLQTKGPEVLNRASADPEHVAQLLEQRQNANKNERPNFAGDDGSQASQAILAELPDDVKKLHRERHQSQMSERVRDTLQKGAVFFHAGTNTTVNLKPRQAPTLTELKSILAAALPIGHIDRERLEKAGKPINVTSALGKMIKGAADRPSAYGWKLIKINS
jgi:hypothetical protein